MQFRCVLLLLSLLYVCSCSPDSNENAPPDRSPSAQNDNEEVPEEVSRRQYSDIWENPGVVMSLVDNLEDKAVAEIGAGVGFFSFRLARRADKVIAIDIEDAFINYMDSLKRIELPADRRDRLETRLATPEDPRLSANEVDAIFIINTLPFINEPAEYLRRLRRTLRPNGQLLIIDFKRKKLPRDINPPPNEYRLPLYRVEEILEEAGYNDYRSLDGLLDYQYVIVVNV